MNIEPSFKRHLKGLDLAKTMRSKDIIYFIDNDYCLQGFNTAWKEFAKKNHGEAILEKYPLGTSILAAITDEARRFYWQVYRQTMHAHKPFDYDYECSSAEQYRLFHQTVVPLNNNRGLMITNHLVKDQPIAFESHKMGKSYFNPGGDIVQCSHCRKVKDHSAEEKWDWVPSLVEKPHPDTQYSFCPRCLKLYHAKITGPH